MNYLKKAKYMGKDIEWASWKAKNLLLSLVKSVVRNEIQFTFKYVALQLACSYYKKSYI